MLNPEVSWCLGVGLCLLAWAFLCFRKGPAEALGPALVLSFAFPVWIKLNILGLPFSIQTAVAGLSLIGYICHPRGRVISPLTALDICVAAVVCSHILTDSVVSGINAALPFRAYGEWALPYVAGRFAVRDLRDVRIISQWVIPLIGVLCCLAVLEAVSGINLFETIFGARPVELANREASRLGFKRAFGPTTHSIYLGILMTMLMPWIFAQIDNHESAGYRKTAWLSLIILLLGLLGTVSRTPLLAFVGTGVVLTATLYQKLRIPVFFCIATTVICLMIWPIQMIDFVSKYTGGSERKPVIEINGEAVEYTSSRSRLLLFDVYAGAIRHAGILGYGSEAVSTFPPKIPYLEGRAEMSNLMRVVDNAHVLTILRFGWLGETFLVALLTAGIVSCLSLYRDRPDRCFAAATMSTLIVYCFGSMWLVSPVYDFAFILLWNLGIVSGLCSQRLTARRVQTGSSFHFK